MKFKCACGQTLATDDTAIGMTVECPSCGKRMQVPAADAPNVVVPPPPAVVESPSSEPLPGLRALAPDEEALPVQDPEAAPMAPPSSEPVFAPVLKELPPRLDMSDAGPAGDEDAQKTLEAVQAAAAETVEVANPLVSPGERKAFRVLMFAGIPALLVVLLIVVATKGAFLFFVALAALAGWLAGQFAAAYVRANAIRVSDHQFRDLHEIVTAFAAKQGKAAPEVYVMQGSAWNAMAMRMARARMVVLLSGAVDSLLLKGDMRQVSWLVGHELGHHFAGHLDFRRRIFVNAGMIFPWLVFWYNRYCELTCDRYGLVCAGSSVAAMRALANMAAGAQMGPKVDIAAAVEQWMQCRRNLFVRWRTLYSSHPHILCRIAETAASARELNVPA